VPRRLSEDRKGRESLAVFFLFYYCCTGALAFLSAAWRRSIFCVRLLRSLVARLVYIARVRLDEYGTDAAAGLFGGHEKNLGSSCACTCGIRHLICFFSVRALADEFVGIPGPSHLQHPLSFVYLFCFVLHVDVPVRWTGTWAAVRMQSFG
jgi:hypothetical protein